MAWSLTPFSVVVLASGGVSLALTVLAFRERPDPMAWPLAVLMLSAACWAIPHAISFGYTETGPVLFWTRIVAVAAVTVPVAYFVLALKYAGYTRWLTRRTYALLVAVPLVTTVLVWTSDAHRLYWESVGIEQVGSVAVFRPEPGPWYWVNLGHSYLLLALSFVVFLTVVFQSEKIYRKQALLMLTGGLVPTIVNIPVVLDLDIAPAIDPTSAALSVSGVTFAIALFRYDLLDLSPAAYRNVPDTFGDGVLVFDGGQCLVEANDHARRILDADVEIGTRAAEIFETSLEEIDGSVVTTNDEVRRFYNVRYSSLEDHRAVAVGHAVVMREVTELKDHQQRLSVTNRILRHNLRNELTIILGEAGGLDGNGPVERIEEAATRLQDVSEKAQYIQSSMRFEEGALVSQDLVCITRSAVEQYRQEFPEADLTLAAPDRALVRTSDREALATAVRNVIENALEHNDHAQPRVEVSIRAGDERVYCSVADNGPGIPEAEREILRDGHETQLQHGSSLGLWLVYWLVSAMGGTVSFEDREPRGTVVTLQFRQVTEPPAGSTVESTDRMAGSAGMD